MANIRFSILPMLAMLIVFTVTSRVAGEETPVGEITEISGSVTVTGSDDRKVDGRKGLPLFPGDQLSTEKGGAVAFSLRQGSIFRLGEEAQVSIDELSSPDTEDAQPTLRLALGYLWSKIQSLTGKTTAPILHTPTAVIGVRGTEFDTVVSMDGTSVVAVDEGTVEVEAEDEKALISKGSMTQAEVGAKPSAPVSAIPKDKRNWQAWRKQRVKMLFKNLPRMAPKYRKRFETNVNRFTRFAGRVRESSDRVLQGIENGKQARRERDRRKVGSSVQKLRAQIRKFKEITGKFRRGLNRVRVMGRLSHRIEKFVEQKKDRFTNEQLAAIEPNLRSISQKRTQLKDVARQTIRKIRETSRKLREFGKQAKKAKSARESRRRNR